MINNSGFNSMDKAHADDIKICLPRHLLIWLDTMLRRLGCSRMSVVH